MLFSGSTTEIIADVRALADLGLATIDVNFAAPTPDAAIAAMRQLHDDVLAKV
jgi:2-keto-3-deoxy-6-phosphogluconate aldolase